MIKFFKDNKKEPKNLEELLNAFRGMEAEMTRLAKEFEDLKKDSKFSVQKIGIIKDLGVETIIAGTSSPMRELSIKETLQWFRDEILTQA